MGLLVSTLGFGKPSNILPLKSSDELFIALLNLLNENSSIATEIIYPLIAGIGIGMLFHAPYQVFTRALKKSEIATGTSAFFLVRFTGATVGLVSFCTAPQIFVAKFIIQAVAGTIFYSHAATRLPADLQSTNGSSSINYTAIRHLPTEQKQEVLHILSASIRVRHLILTSCRRTLTYGGRS